MYKKLSRNMKDIKKTKNKKDAIINKKKASVG